MTNHEPIIYQPEINSITMKTMTSSGTLEDYKRKIIVSVAPHDYLVTAVAVSCTGVLLKPAREDSKGLHIHGGSSRGKTTLLQVASSHWGNGSDPAADANAYIQRWNATLNAFEAICMAHNDILLCLDEIHSCNAKDLRKVIYDTTGGRGKNALTSNRDLKDRREWRTFILSSGEKSVRQAIEEEGKTATAGVLVRLADVPIVGNIVPDRKTAEAIKAACSEFYGVAGIEFLRKLIAEYKTTQALSSAVITMRDEAFETLPTTDSPTKGRTLKHFALIKTAGLLMVKLLDLAPYGITSERVNASVNFVAQAWLDGAEMLPDMERAIQQVRNFILEHRESRFYVLPKDERSERVAINKLAGYWDKSLDRYYFVDPGWTEACRGFDELEVAKEFNRRQYLFKNDGEHLKTKFSPGNGEERLKGYTVKGSLLLPEELKNEASNEA